ncbi:MAG: phosphoserine phosphatase SerB [Bacteriovoracales bacterium]|nr:phosphoserine phosphatase SerB [Bacteriovoracales bacterium]
MPDIRQKENMEKERILVTVTGPDKTGITASLMDIVVKSEYEILDIGQSVIHGLLSLSFIIIDKGREKRREAPPILKDLLFAAKKMRMNLDFKIVSTRFVYSNSANKFILSCVNKQSIAPLFLFDVSKMLADFGVNILRIDKMNSEDHFKSVDMVTVASSDTDLVKMKSGLLQVAQTHQTDMAFFKENVSHHSKRLIVFDMDSTLIQAEVIDEMAKIYGVEKEVSQITEEAMNGRLDFTESLFRRVSILKGLEQGKMQDLVHRLPITAGAREFIDTVKKLGYKLALISGGFDFFAESLKEQLGLDYAFANKLETKNGRLTGKLLGPIICAEKKATLLEQIAEKEKINLDQVVAIGDGANDLPMLSKAGLGIAFNAKESVKERADGHMSFGPMDTILHFLGIYK